MRNNTIAIDFGSVNTVIYQLGAGVVLSEPTVIALTASEKPTVKAVGTEAKKLIGKTAETTRIVFPVAEGQVADIKNATLTLENFLNTITLRKLSLRPKVVLSVPCGLENSEIKKYEKVLAAAGVYLAGYVFNGAIVRMPDLLLTAGTALAVFALALLLVWAGISLAVAGCTLTVRLTRSIYRSILYPKKEANGDE